MLDVADTPSSGRLIGALVNNIRAHEVERQSTDENQYYVWIGIHYPNEILKIGEEYGQS
jgi:hypothetical protein